MRLTTSHPQLVQVPPDAGHYPEKAAIELSLVVPIHNESAGLDEFFARVLPVLPGPNRSLGLRYSRDCDATSRLDR